MPPIENEFLKTIDLEPCNYEIFIQIGGDCSSVVNLFRNFERFHLVLNDQNHYSIAFDVFSKLAVERKVAIHWHANFKLDKILSDTKNTIFFFDLYCFQSTNTFEIPLKDYLQRIIEICKGKVLVIIEDISDFTPILMMSRSRLASYSIMASQIKPDHRLVLCLK